MRWVVFIIFAAPGVAFDTGLGAALRLENLWSIQPSLCGVIAAFVVLSAPRPAALGACFVIGTLLDLSNQLTVEGGEVRYLVGPYTLGFVVGGWLVLEVRSAVFRRRALTIGVMTSLLLLAAQAVALILFVVRSRDWYPGGPLYWTDTSAGLELFKRLLTAVYSGLLAIPVGWLLVRTMPLWGFRTVTHRTPSTIR